MQRTNVLLLFLLLARFLALAKALDELDQCVDTYHFLLEIWWLSVKHIYRLDSVVNHTQRAVKETEQMARHLASIRHHLLAIRLAHSNEELVQAHRRVDSHLASKECLDVKLLDTCRYFIAEQ